MARRVTIKDDRRGMDRLKREIKEAGHKHVVIGFTHDVGGDIIKYATANEMGVQPPQAKPHSFTATPKGGPHVPFWFHVSGKIPSRPFMRRYYDDNLDKIGAFAERQFLKMLTTDGFTINMAFSAIGLRVQNGVKNSIRTAHEWAVPNAPLTILLKGSSKPLIDHGIMINTVTFDIRGGR